MFKRLILTLLVLVATVAACLVYGGYFDRTPFVYVPAARPGGRVAALIISSDMGFKFGSASKVAGWLAADGVPVVVVNSLAYFRHRRTPAEVEQLLDDAVRRTATFGHVDKVIVMGQSFGADMVPAGLANASPELRKKIAMVALVVPAKTISYRASPGGVFDWAETHAAALPIARRLDWAPLLCIYGQQESDSLCPLLPQDNARKIAMPGGHFLNRDDVALHHELKSSIKRILPDAFPSARNNVQIEGTS